MRNGRWLRLLTYVSGSGNQELLLRNEYLIRSWPGIDGFKHRQYPGRPPVSSEVETLVVRMVRENSGWGYDRIIGALANLGHQGSDQTVGNILRRHGIAPAPKRSEITTWRDFLAAHMNVRAGCDFFTVEVLTWRGLVTY